MVSASLQLTMRLLLPRRRRLRKKAPAKKAPAKKRASKKKKAPAVKGQGKRTPNYTNEEDLFLCKAYINKTVNIGKGTDIMSLVFWGGIKNKFVEIYMEEAEVIPPHLDTRDASSLKTRWVRNINKYCQLWNKYYIRAQATPKSGENQDYYINLATEDYEEELGKPFLWSHCIPTLLSVPTFFPKTLEAKEGEEGGEEAASKINQLGAAMGDTLKRPGGQKAFKKGEKDAMTAATIESKMMVQNEEQIASSNRLNDIMDRKSRMDSLMQMARMAREMGDMETAKEYMDMCKTEVMESKDEANKAKAEAANKKKASIPKTITLATNPTSGKE